MIIIEICLLGRTYGVRLVLLLLQILNKSTSTLFNDNNQLKLQLWQGRHSLKVEEIFCRCIIFNLFKTFLCLTIIVKIDRLNKPWVYKYVTISVNYATLTYIFLIFPFNMRNGKLFSVRPVFTIGSSLPFSEAGQLNNWKLYRFLKQAFKGSFVRMFEWKFWAINLS